MERKVQIYIEGERLELFNDEKINVNSTVQNIADIAKVFTDFSQSFTVPATPKNNAIFEHFYANEVDGTLNYNLRRDAFIEIDLSSFRTGKIQLEKSEIKNLYTDSYTLTFYGDVRSLKDRFSEDKLSQLDYSAYTHPYTGAEVLDRVTDIGMSYDVRYPLISSKRVWQYDEPTTPLDNIDTIDGRIFYDELFPAIKVARVFDVLEATYGVTFSGSWLQTQRFQQLFMLCKNANSFTNLTPTERIDITAQSNPSLGLTVHPDNIRAVLSDPEDIVRTEVLCQWVDTINPVINASQWESCRVEGLRLNPEADTWLAIDLSPSRKEAALVASQRLEGDKFLDTLKAVEVLGDDSPNG